MTISDLISLLISIIAFLSSIGTLLFSIIYQRHDERVHKRAIPYLSILDQNNNISKRIHQKYARIFITLSDAKTTIQNASLCLCLQNQEQSKMMNCSLRIVIDRFLDVQYNLGTVTEGRPVMIPMRLEIPSFEKFFCEIQYATECNEKIIYEVETQKNFQGRIDNMYLKKTLRKKRLRGINFNLSTSYSYEEIYNLEESNNENHN